MKGLSLKIGTVTYFWRQSLFQYSGWNLAAEYDAEVTPPAVLWTCYHEGGLYSVVGGVRQTATGAENYIVLKDHLGSIVAVMQFHQRAEYTCSGGGPEKGGQSPISSTKKNGGCPEWH